MPSLNLSLVTTLLATFALSLPGCSTSTSNEKKTLFDEDHLVPDHWPQSVYELSQSFDYRLDLLLQTDQLTDSTTLQETAEELRDLISWAPEITAASPLTEDQWNPIHELTEELNELLRTMPTPTWSQDTLEKTEELGKLLREAASRIAEDAATPISPQAPEPTNDEELK